MASEVVEGQITKSEQDVKQDATNVNGGQGINNQNRSQNIKPRGQWKKTFANVSIKLL